LLRALVGPPDERLVWWEKWRSSIDLSDVDPATFHLLPLASRRFPGSAGDDTERLAGVYRYTWYRNRMLVHAGAGVLRRLDEAGVAHVILKGAALATTTYHDRGTRPISDVDVLVRSADRDRAVALLLDAGWQPDSPVPTEMLRVHHAFNVSAGPLASVDLHWGILYLDRNPEADRRAWARSVPIELDAVATRALCSTDQLLHALVHAELDDLRWIVDAGLLIEQGDIDWSLFCREVELRRVVSWVMRALTTAEDLGGVAVPPDVYERLARVSMSRWDRMVLRTQEQPATRAALAARAVDTFARRTRGLRPGERAKAIGPYLAQISGAAPWHRSLGVLTSRLVRSSAGEPAA
jgi:hypothetical protein